MAEHEIPEHIAHEEPTGDNSPERSAEATRELREILKQVYDIREDCDAIRQLVYEVGSKPALHTGSEEGRTEIVTSSAAVLTRVIRRAGAVVSRIDEVTKLLRISRGSRLFEKDNEVLAWADGLGEQTQLTEFSEKIDQEFDALEASLGSLEELAREYVDGAAERTTSPDERRLLALLDDLREARQIEYLQHVANYFLTRLFGAAARDAAELGTVEV